MRVSVCVSAAVFSTAAFSAITPFNVARQADVITGVLSGVGEKITAVDSAVTAYDGSDAEPVLDAGKTLVSTINSGVATAKASEDLTLEGSLALQDPVKDLTDKASSLVDNLTGKRSLIAEKRQCATTRAVVNDIDAASNELIDTIVAKVPQEAQGIAQTLVSDLQAVLAKAKTNFNEQNCVDAAAAPSQSSAQSSAQPSTSAQPSGKPSEAPAATTTAKPVEQPSGTVAPTAKPSSAQLTYGASSAHGEVPSGSPTAVVPPPPAHTGTPTGPVVVPTAGAGALLPPCLVAVGVAVAML
ncbi:hypothetical protein NLU13_7349 [Sarocladium strictum]|uniref:Cell wall protein n=1 Tax=Sarocladium strictum TaxID=5046 RepID=A0AA39L543_SARSR|nr:hypothetical protein NLU13_7349 [Sarocladium strictum]